MSREIRDLTIDTATRVLHVIDLCAERGVDLLIYCTHRTIEDQAKLFRQGRPLSEIRRMIKALDADWGRSDLAAVLEGVGPQHGPKVTNAAPGQSAHQYRCAADGVPIVNGKAIWDATDPRWIIYGEAAQQAGLEWAGTWKKFREFPHVQQAGFDWRTRIGSYNFSEIP